MLTQVEANYLNVQLYRCHFQRNHKSCAYAELLVAILIFRYRIEDLLKPKFNPPIGPEPAPDSLIRMLAEGDPDGSPARFFPVMESNSTGRIQMAREFHSAILKLAGEVEANIEELEAANRS